MNNNIDSKMAKESGQVAIISVMFFMILFSVVVVSFMRAVVAEQRQTMNSELSASALAAAESGIEDAKRILSYCEKNPTSNECQIIFSPNNNNCSSIIGSSVLMSKLNSNTVDISGSKQVVVDSTGDEKYQEYYSCLVIHYLTLDYVGTANPNGQSTVVPLRFVNSLNQDVESAAYFSVAWHSNSESGNKPVTGLDSSYNLPTVQAWKAAGNRPAVLRIELVAVPKSGFTLDQITNNARAATLRPSTSSAGGQTIATVAAGNNAYNMDFWQQSTEPNASNPSILQVGCTASTQAYACWLPSFTTSTGKLDLLNNWYYLRVQSIYNDADFQVTAVGADGQSLYFNGVQPSIDVTGRASDSFKRLSSRVRSGVITSSSAENWWPEYGLESGSEICKDMTVRKDFGTDNCSY